MNYHDGVLNLQILDAKGKPQPAQSGYQQGRIAACACDGDTFARRGFGRRPIAHKIIEGTFGYQQIRNQGRIVGSTGPGQLRLQQGNGGIPLAG